MNDRKTDETYMMQCKLCGNIQSREHGTCDSCGADMALYGKVVRIQQGGSDSGRSSGSGKKTNKLLPVILGLACVVLVVVFAAKFLVGPV